MGKEAWDAMNEGDDIKFYLASDNSSASEESDDDDEGDVDVETKTKSRKMRALLGLGGSDDEADEDDAANASDGSCDGSDDDAGKNAKLSEASSESESDEEAEPKTKQVTFTPGKKNLEEKIRSKLRGDTTELTPFQKYLEKRKEKRRERRQAARKKGKGGEPDSVVTRKLVMTMGCTALIRSLEWQSFLTKSLLMVLILEKLMMVTMTTSFLKMKIQKVVAKRRNARNPKEKMKSQRPTVRTEWLVPRKSWSCSSLAMMVSYMCGYH